MTHGDRGSRRCPSPGVTIRRAQPGDRELLLRHFQQLPASDRRLRFFGDGPPEDHTDRWLGLTAHGGVTLIALAGAADGSPRCVGEGCFVPRGDGTAEFALSVAVDARGGLGTALLEELRHLAAAEGIGGLHGEVLLQNGPMNHLLRRRGGVTVERDDRMSAGVLIGTTRGAPPWPEVKVATRRVLVEARNGRWAGEEQLRAAGFQVAVCPGPEARPAADPCPLLVGRPCRLIDGADLVVHDLPADVATHRAVAAALTGAAGDKPVLARGPDAPSVDARAVETTLGNT